MDWDTEHKNKQTKRWDFMNIYTGKSGKISMLDGAEFCVVGAAGLRYDEGRQGNGEHFKRN